MKSATLTSPLLLLLLGAVPVAAQDVALGLRTPIAPRFDGQRAITINAPPPPAGSSWFQEPFTRSVPGARSRLVLEYTTDEAGWSGRHRIVAEVEPLGRSGRFRATAILPQGQLVPVVPPGVQLPRHLDGRFHDNPLAVEHGTRVLYRWRREDGSQARLGDVHEFAMPHPLVIAIMGDSYGAGEGAPEEESTFLTQVRWEDRDSHRSDRSGQRKAVVRFRNAHPGLWVEFTHVGISGATLSPADKSGYLTDYRGARELKVLAVPPPIPMRPVVEAESQFGLVEAWLARNGYERTHVLVMTGGGNDAGFVDIIQGAILGTLRFDFANTLRQFRANLETLREVAENELVPALDAVIRPQHVLWTTYPNLTRDQNGAHSAIDVAPTINPGLALMDAVVGGDDMANAELLLVEELNPAIREICEQVLERCRVADVEDAAIGHGINADPDNRWFNTFTDAQDRVQGAVDGAVHPNEVGQDLFIGAVLGGIEALYHPRSGSEYRRMAREAAAEKVLARAGAERAARRDAAQRGRLRLDASHSARAAAKARAARAARAKETESRYRLENILRNRLESAELRLALPTTARVAELRSVLTRAGRRAVVPELEEQLRRLRAVERDPAGFRRAMAEAEAKERAGASSRVRRP